MTTLPSHVEPLPDTDPALPLSADPATESQPQREHRIERWIYSILAVLLVAGFFYSAACYWVPAHQGVDQNGYLVGGRMLAENLTMRQSPVAPGTSQFDPHQFIGRMWIGAELDTPAARYYPKYPLGLPMLVATALWLGGDMWGPWLAYWINPIAMALAVGATFLLIREVAGSF